MVQRNGIGRCLLVAKVDYAAGLDAGAIAAADLNGDSKPDLAVANFSNDTIGVFLNNGQGLFDRYFEYAAGRDPIWVGAADLNSDGRIDLAVTSAASNTVSVLLNTCMP